MSSTYAIANDYRIKIQDWFTSQYIDLGTDSYCSVTFDGVGSPEIREAVYNASGGDGILFGREYYGVINWTIAGSVFGGANRNAQGSASSSWGSYSDLVRAWVNYPERRVARAVKPMYFKRPGREAMVVFGRPGRIDPDTKQSHAGFITYTAMYRQSDPRFYSATEKTTGVSLTANYSGGLRLTSNQNAFIQPFTTTTANYRSSRVINEGDANTDVQLVFNGPVENPSITLVGSGIKWTVLLRTQIAAGHTVKVDARQWARAITNDAGGSLAGVYNGPKLQDLVIPPGSYDVLYTGNDTTGTSSCQILYRNAWFSS